MSDADVEQLASLAAVRHRLLYAAAPDRLAAADQALAAIADALVAHGVDLDDPQARAALLAVKHVAGRAALDQLDDGATTAGSRHAFVQVVGFASTIAGSRHREQRT
jgi:hypothetical protein